MASVSVEALINDNKLERAASIIDDVLRSSKNESSVACSILKVVASFSTKSVQQQTLCKSDAKHIFKLANHCSQTLSESWKCDHVNFMLYIYYICDYLIKAGDALNAKELVSYFALLKENNVKHKVGCNIWSTKQKDILVNILTIFVNALLIDDNKSVITNNIDSVQSWWTSIMSLSELCNHQNISYTFQITAVMFSNLNVPDVLHLGNFVFEQYFIIINGLQSCKPIETQRDLNMFVTMLNSYFSAVFSDELITSNHINLLNILKTVSSTVNDSLSAPVKLIWNLTSLLNENSSQEVAVIIAKISEDINSLGSFANKEFINFISTFNFKLFKTIKNKSCMIENIDCLFKLAVTTMNAFSTVLPRLKLNQKQYNFIANRLVCGVLVIVINFEGSTEKLKSVLNYVWSAFSFFFKHGNFEESMAEFNFGVDFCKRVIAAFVRSECYHEAKELCRLVLINLRSTVISSPPPIILKNILAQIMNYFVEASSKSYFSYECLTYLLAIANDQNPLFDFEDKFEYWCKLKLLPGNDVEMVTVYDIIVRDSSRQLDETVVNEILKWPFSLVITLDFEELLLLEIKSYLKHKDLLKVPVLSVYKIAVTNVKSKVILARVLCCATEASINQSDSIPTINKFQLSLKNMIKICSSKNNELSVAEKHLLVGDMYYYLARCEIYIQRHSAQKLLVDLQPSTCRDALLLPIVENPLDSTIVSCEFSFIAYKTQDSIRSHLNQAYESWSEAAAVIKNSAGPLNLLKTDVASSMYHIRTTGYLYRLFRNIRKEILMWQLLFDLSNLCSHSKYKIIGFSELLNTTIRFDESQIDEMNSFVQSHCTENDYFYFLFLISLGKNKLYNKQYSESEEIFKLIDEPKLRMFQLVRIQYSIFSYWLQSALSSFDKTNSRLLINQFEHCLILQKKNVYCNFLQQTINDVLLLDISLMVSRMFCEITDVRFARFYSCSALKYAQELHLPIRTCELLTLQAQTDQLCLNISDASEKLSGIATVLGLSLKTLDCDLHPSDCTCSPCNHIEYKICQIYALLIKAGLFKLQNETNKCITIFKDAHESITKLKKRFNGNYTTDIVECDIFFSKMAIDVLTKWSKLEKAIKYLDHGLKYIQNSYKPYDGILSSICLANTLKLKFSVEITPCNVTSVESESDSDEPCKTPQMTSRELTSPPPIGWKACFNEKDVIEMPHDIPKHKAKKIIFNNSPSEVKTNSSSSDQENSFNVVIKSKIPVSNSKKTRRVNGTTPTQLIKNIPTIVILSDSDEDDGLSTDYCEKKRNNNLKEALNKLNTPSGKIFKSIKAPRNLKMITPSKSSVAVFSDAETKTATSRLKMSKKVNKSDMNKKFKKSDCSKKLFSSDDSQESKHKDSESVSDQVQDTVSTDHDDSEISIIDATIIEDSEIKLSKLQLTNTPKVDTLESKFSNLHVTPCSSLNPSLHARTTVKKDTRHAKLNSLRSVKKQKDSGTAPASDINLHPLANCDLSPKARVTRSSKKLLSSTKKYRI